MKLQPLTLRHIVMQSAYRTISLLTGDISTLNGELTRNSVNEPIGQVVALFIVGLGEYLVVWLGTNWEKEVQIGIERNKEEAKRRLLHTRTGNE